MPDNFWGSTLQIPNLTVASHQQAAAKKLDKFVRENTEEKIKEFFRNIKLSAPLLADVSVLQKLYGTRFEDCTPLQRYFFIQELLDLIGYEQRNRSSAV